MHNRLSPPKHLASRPALVAAFALAAGCGSNQASTPDAAILPSADGAATEAAQAGEAAGPATSYCTSKAAAAGVTQVAGTWVIRASGSQVVTALGYTLHPKTLFYLLVDLTQSGNAVTLAGRYCDRAEDDGPGAFVTVVIPAPWAHTEKPVSRPGQLALGTDGTAVLSFPPFVEVAGAVLAAPTDPLPTSATDPRVIDEDNDGNPGITVNVTGLATGSLYSVQRQTTAGTMVAVAADRFEGVLDFKSDQNVIGSNPPTLQSLYAAPASGTDTTPCSNTLAMVKVADAGADTSAITCAWVRASEATLFPQ